MAEALKVQSNPEWIKTKELKKKELEALKEIFLFYVINTPYDSYSFRSINVTEYGWPENVWSTNELKEQLYHIANLNFGSSLIKVEFLKDMESACELANLKEDFYKKRDKERVVVYVNSNSNTMLSIFKNMRNALAHGRFEMYPSGEDYIFVMESVEKNNNSYEVKARMVLRQSTLLEWIKIIKKGPQEKALKRKRTKK